MPPAGHWTILAPLGDDSQDSLGTRCDPPVFETSDAWSSWRLGGRMAQFVTVSFRMLAWRRLWIRCVFGIYSGHDEEASMGEQTQIEWTDSTWNPVTGCTQLTAGCDNCYALTLAHGRLKSVYTRQPPAVNTPANRSDPFAVRLWPARLTHPSHWAEPRMVFVNSMSDMFHADIPREFLRRVFRVMLEVDRHIYQVLTKRPARAIRFVEQNPDLFDGGMVPDHIWMGTSVENSDVAYRVRHLRAVPAETRFLSCEPLLGPLDLALEGIHWVIVGGESGLGYRAMEPELALGVLRQCRAARVPFFFKQWGGRTPKAGGRVLDGKVYDEWPAMVSRLSWVA